MALICALGTAAPDASETSPWIVALATAWARAGALQIERTANKASSFTSFLQGRLRLAPNRSERFPGRREIGEPHFDILAGEHHAVGPRFESRSRGLANIVRRGALVRAPRR